MAGPFLNMIPKPKERKGGKGELIQNSRAFPVEQTGKADSKFARFSCRAGTGSRLRNLLAIWTLIPQYTQVQIHYLDFKIFILLEEIYNLRAYELCFSVGNGHIKLIKFDYY